MRKCVLFLQIMFCVNCIYAQADTSPVKWSFNSRKIDALTYEIHMTAEIGDGWHTYSRLTPGGGPVPTAITFTPNPLILLPGDVEERGKMEKHFEPLFNVEVWQFSEKVEFVQIVKIKGKIKTNLAGTIKFMVCNDEQCLPPTEKKFSISIN